MKHHASGMGGIAMLTAILLSGCAINPTPFTSEEISASSQDKLARVTSEQEPVTGTIDLAEAMARALKYNLDHKVEIYETSLRTAELNLAHYNMLPNAVASSGYGVRDNIPASSSFNSPAPASAQSGFSFPTSARSSRLDRPSPRIVPSSPRA